MSFASSFTPLVDPTGQTPYHHYAENAVSIAYPEQLSTIPTLVTSPSGGYQYIAHYPPTVYHPPPHIANHKTLSNPKYVQFPLNSTISYSSADKKTVKSPVASKTPNIGANSKSKSSRRPDPVFTARHEIPGYTGFVPNLKSTLGKTYLTATKQAYTTTPKAQS